MKIVIDMQGAQAQSKGRGIGRYSRELATAILRINPSHDIHLLFNEIFDVSDHEILDFFRKLLPHSNIHVWRPAGPIFSLDQANKLRNAAAKQHYYAYLRSLEPDCLVITSLFEGISDDALTAVDPQRNYSVAVILYDLIPYIMRSPYLDEEAHAIWYEEKIEHLRRADLLLSISESSRREAIEHLGFPSERVVNISSAIDDFFRKVDVLPERQQVLRTHYGLNEEFILYTGGVDYRKNMEGLIRAFALIPSSLRGNHQLAIVCKMDALTQARLKNLAHDCGLPENALALTGYIPDHDLRELYSLCKVFVFPSLHEGFGLPALEAMACGAPVIASNTSSMPEVIGRDDALFDPRDPESIATKLAEILENESLRKDLSRHSLQQARKFSWSKTAQRAIQAIQALDIVRPQDPLPSAPLARPRLAFVSPLPPERSGISEYSAMLLPALSEHYEVHLIVQQNNIDLPELKGNYHLHDSRFLRDNQHLFDRVVYQMGNSSFHAHMFELLEDIPGVVVLHDFYLSGIQAYREYALGLDHHLARTLYTSHGYPALLAHQRGMDMSELIWKYPCNLDVLQQCRGLIVHSGEASRLLQQWYGVDAGRDVHTIPLVRAPAMQTPQARALAREQLGLSEDAFVVCSFGYVSESKLGDRLVQAWMESGLYRDPAAHLIFVGHAEGEYGKQLERTITDQATQGHIRITGWLSQDTYRQYLHAADVAVQLRQLSRGETSAAVLDCMNHGLATIVNAHGSMADLPEGAVLKMDDDFKTSDLAHALCALRLDPGMRSRLGEKAARHIHVHHTPALCARQYREAIEAAYARPSAENLMDRLAALPGLQRADVATLDSLANAVHQDFPPPIHPPQLLLDVSRLVQGQESPLVAGLMHRLLMQPPSPFRLEPVYLDAHGQARYARRLACRHLGINENLLTDDLIEFAPGDAWLTLDHPTTSADEPIHRTLRLRGVHVGLAHAGDLPGTVDTQIQQLGDLLSMTGPAASAGRRIMYIDITELAREDRRTGIQRVVRSILTHWRNAPPPGLEIRCCHALSPGKGYQHAKEWALGQLGYPRNLLPDTPIDPQPGDIFLGLDLAPHHVPEQAHALAAWRKRGVHTAFVVYDLLCLEHPEFFIEGAQQTFTRWLSTVAEADQLFAISHHVAGQLKQRLGERTPPIEILPMGADLDSAPAEPDPIANARVTTWFPFEAPALLMVGTLEPRKGHEDVLNALEHLWGQGQALSLIIVGRRGWMVDDLVQRLESHPRRGQQLFWLHDADDATLDVLYRRCTLLLNASHDEGFGLPLIEAARAGLPVLARDIPIFREVMGDHALYFNDARPAPLATAIQNALRRHAQGTLPRSSEVHIHSWAATARQLTSEIMSRIGGKG